MRKGIGREMGDVYRSFLRDDGKRKGIGRGEEVMEWERYFWWNGGKGRGQKW